MVLDTSLLNTLQYKERIKGKVEQSRKMSSALPYTLKREPSGRPRLKVVNFTYLITLFYDISTFVGYLMLKQFLKKNRIGAICRYI